MAGGGLSVPMMGPVGAPVLAQPNIGVQLGEAAATFPEQQRKAQLEQAELDAQNMQNATQKLSVLTKLISSNPAIASNPQIVDAGQRAFKQMGMTAPMVSQNGVNSLDTQALSSFGPWSDFIAQNLPMILQTDPADRAALITAGTGGAAPPQGIVDALSKLPRRFLQSPGEATGLLTYVRSMVQSLGKPGGSLENAAAAIDAVSKPLSEIGIDASMLIDQLKPDLYAQALQAAQLSLLSARTDDERAKAQTLIQTLPAKIASINSTADLRKVMAEYYPQVVADRTTTANAAATRASVAAGEEDSVIARNKAQATKDMSDADAAHQLAIQRRQQNATDGLKAKDLLTAANNSQQLYDRLESSYTQAIADSQTYAQSNPTYAAQAKKTAEELLPRLAQAQADAAEAEKEYTDSLHGGTTHQPPKKPPADMKPGTVEYYHSLDAAGRQAYLQNSNVPADVRAYLQGLP